MSTPAHEALRERLGILLGGSWGQDLATGEALLLPPDAPVVHLVADDLALTRRDRLWRHLGRLAARQQRLWVWASLMPLSGRAATLLAPDVWRALFAAVGLQVVLDVPDGSAVSDEVWTGPWRQADPYRLGDVSRIGFVLDPGAPVDPAVGAAAARRLIGPQQPDSHAGARVGVLISGYQDFHTLQPWLARVRADDRVVLLRDARFGQTPGTLGALHAAVAPYEARPAHLDAGARDVLTGAGIDVLVSASESTANLAHLGNAAALLVARGLGIASAHAQHGIWPRAEFPPPVTSVADVVLAWAEEYREVIAPPTPVAVVGGPRFDRYADRVHRGVSGLYGGWTARYARHVVLATNLHWAQHTEALDAAGLAAHLAGHFPDTLFTLKPHPYEALGPDRVLPPNVVVLSQPIMLAAGIEPADVVEAADLVVTTPSTFALEAALAGRPYLVLATGNANRHDHVGEHAAAAIDGWLRAPTPDAAAAAYVARYRAPETHGCALERALAAVRDLGRPRTPPADGAAHAVSGLLAAVARLGEEHRRLHEQTADAAAEARRYVESLQWTLQRKDEYIASLHARLGITPS